MANSASIEALKGTWDYVDGDNMEDYLKELGVGMMGRMMSRGIKPRLVITEKDGIWTHRTETIFKTMTIEFTPNVEYEETTADGREIKGIIQFENGQWIQKMCDKNGKESMTTRWIDENGQQQLVLECGKAKVHRFYQRAQ